MINFPFGTNGKSIILGVPILKHITVRTTEEHGSDYWAKLWSWSDRMKPGCFSSARGSRRHYLVRKV